tara:strand:+ start:1224 stop:1769 length:546 start_codon:yes stop_codon:yes gene_type:complete
MKIFGHITDSSTGNPMPYVNIARIGTTIGTTTDGNGFFTLEGSNLDPNWEFTISHIGYTTLKRKASNMQGNSIFMAPSSTVLSEVVIKGKKYDPTKTTSWIGGLTTGWNLGGAPKSDVTYGSPNPTRGAPPYSPQPIGLGTQPTTPYAKFQQQQKINTLVWVGLGAGLLFLTVVIVIVSRK